MEECCICLEKLKADITLLKCLHKFHSKCLYNTFKYSHQCPLCREDIIIIANVDTCIINGTVTYVKRKSFKKCVIL